MMDCCGGQRETACYPRCGGCEQPYHIPTVIMVYKVIMVYWYISLSIYPLSAAISPTSILLCDVSLIHVFALSIKGKYIIFLYWWI